MDNDVEKLEELISNVLSAEQQLHDATVIHQEAVKSYNTAAIEQRGDKLLAVYRNGNAPQKVRHAAMLQLSAILVGERPWQEISGVNQQKFYDELLEHAKEERGLLREKLADAIVAFGNTTMKEEGKQGWANLRKILGGSNDLAQREMCLLLLKKCPAIFGNELRSNVALIKNILSKSLRADTESVECIASMDAFLAAAHYIRGNYNAVESLSAIIPDIIRAFSKTHSGSQNPPLPVDDAEEYVDPLLVFLETLLTSMPEMMALRLRDVLYEFMKVIVEFKQHDMQDHLDLMEKLRKVPSGREHFIAARDSLTAELNSKLTDELTAEETDDLKRKLDALDVLDPEDTDDMLVDEQSE